MVGILVVVVGILVAAVGILVVAVGILVVAVGTLAIEVGTLLVVEVDIQSQQQVATEYKLVATELAVAIER